MIAKTSTQRSRELRAGMRKAGYILRHVWVHPADWKKIKALIDRAIEKRRGI